MKFINVFSTVSLVFLLCGLVSAQFPPIPGCNPPDCNDNNPCTSDACMIFQCMHYPIAGSCPGGQCMMGFCVPDNPCPNGCDDGNPCTTDMCMMFGCLNMPIMGCTTTSSSTTSTTVPVSSTSSSTTSSSSTTTSTTIPASSTTQPTTTIHACVPEGGFVPIVPGAPECCQGLTQISCNAPGPNQACMPCAGAGICTQCGNGVCGLGENVCNCPDDCVSTTTVVSPTPAPEYPSKLIPLVGAFATIGLAVYAAKK